MNSNEHRPLKFINQMLKKIKNSTYGGSNRVGQIDLSKSIGLCVLYFNFC